MKKYFIVALVIVAMFDGRCELPDVAVADKLFADGRFVEALKGYVACERARIGEPGHVIMREAECAEKTGDSVLRGIALKKLCAMDAGGNSRRYVEAAYRMRYEKDVADTLHTGDLDRFLREIIKKFGGKGYAAEVAGTELKKLIRREEWNNAGRYLRQYQAAYPEGLTNAVDFIGVHLVKAKPVSDESLRRLSGLFAYDVRLAEFIVGKCDKLAEAWRLHDCMGNLFARRAEPIPAIRSYERARSFPKSPAADLDYKILSVELVMPARRRAAVERALMYLKSRPDSKWHPSVFHQTVKVMFDEKLFDEVDLLLADKTVCREGYRNEQVKAIETAIAAERDKVRKAEVARKTGGNVDETFRQIGESRRKGDFAAAVAKCDELMKTAGDDSVRERALRLSAEICFEDAEDFKSAGERYGRLIRLYYSEGRNLRLEMRLIESMVINGQNKAAKSRIDEVKRVFNADLDVDDQHMLDSLAVISGRVESKRAGAAAQTLRRADVLFAAEEYSRALKHYKSVAGIKGTSRNTISEALMQEARCLARTGQYDKALSCYAKLERQLGRHLMSSDALMRMAVIYAGNFNNGRKAMELYSRVENEYPWTDNAEQAMFYRMTLLMFSGEWDKAGELRKRFLRICKNDNARKTADTIYGGMIARRSIVSQK